MRLVLVLTPHGSLTLRREGETAMPELEHGVRLELAFGRGTGHGLLCLGADEVGAVLAPVRGDWRGRGGAQGSRRCAPPGRRGRDGRNPAPRPGGEQRGKRAGPPSPRVRSE